MRYIPITCEQREAMLRAVGRSSTGELFDDVPGPVRLDEPLDLPAGLSEIELSAHVRELANLNVPATSMVCFAGGGYYDHHVPSVVDHVISRPEFFTAYTPYQPEVSQGTLQAVWEYQSMICALTGMEVANASMYDGATALVEAALMAARLTRRHRVVAAGMIHPDWLQVLDTYAEAGTIEIVEHHTPHVDAAELAEHLDDSVAAVLVASPNFTGSLEDLAPVAEAAHAAGALLVVASNPVLLGVLEPPASFGADIVVGEGQPLGSGLNYGGPGLGFFACREKHVRQMPGRLVGRTVDADGSPAFVLTLSTREQHIRRERATSNICSNHALNALAAGAYLSALGQEGLAGVARSCVAKAHYLREQLLATGRFESPWEPDLPFGYEFALAYLGDSSAFYSALFEQGFVPGVVLETDEDEPDLVLFAVTEKRTRSEIDAFVEAVRSL